MAQDRERLADVFWLTELDQVADGGIPEYVPWRLRLAVRFDALTMLTAARCVRDGCATPVVLGRGEGVAKPVRAAVGNVWVKCSFCQGDLFRDREVKLNSSGMEFMNFGWANESATGLICWNCGYVHLFVNRDLELYKVKKDKG